VSGSIARPAAVEHRSARTDEMEMGSGRAIGDRPISAAAPGSFKGLWSYRLSACAWLTDSTKEVGAAVFLIGQPRCVSQHFWNLLSTHNDFGARGVPDEPVPGTVGVGWAEERSS